MFALFLAAAAASSWGFSAVLVRFGLRDMATTLGTLISLCAGWLFTGALVLAFEAGGLFEVTLGATLLFGIVGILNFPMGRFLNYLSMEHLGVGRSTPILASAPVFAVVIAVTWGGESLGLVTLLGGALICAGLLVTVMAPRS